MPEAGAPAPPEPVVESDGYFEPDWRNIGDGYLDSFVDEPWRHDWGALLGE